MRTSTSQPFRRRSETYQSGTAEEHQRIAALRERRGSADRASELALRISQSSPRNVQSTNNIQSDGSFLSVGSRMLKQINEAKESNGSIHDAIKGQPQLSISIDLVDDQVEDEVAPSIFGSPEPSSNSLKSENAERSLGALSADQSKPGSGPQLGTPSASPRVSPSSSPIPPRKSSSSASLHRSPDKRHRTSIIAAASIASSHGGGSTPLLAGKSKGKVGGSDKLIHENTTLKPPGLDVIVERSGSILPTSVGSRLDVKEAKPLSSIPPPLPAPPAKPERQNSLQDPLPEPEPVRTIFGRIWRSIFTKPLIATLYKQVIEAKAGILNNPNAHFWGWYDWITRAIDIFYLVSTPLVVCFVCDITESIETAFMVPDAIIIVSTVLRLIRPTIDSYGQTITDPRERRKVHFRRFSAWLEILGSVPYDWIILGLNWHFGTAPTCLRPVYVYPNGQTSNIPVPQLTPFDQRYDYHPENIPLHVNLYAYLRAARLLRTFNTLGWLTDLRLPGMSDGISRLAKTLLFSIFLAHIDGALFWVISTPISSSARWITREYVIVDTEGVLTPLSERFMRNLYGPSGHFKRSLVSLKPLTFCFSYGAQRAMFFLPREVTTLPEITFQTVELLFAAVLYGSVFGNLVSIVRTFDAQAAMDKAAKQRNFKRQYLATHMIRRKFPPPLQKKILDQEEFDWVHKKGLDVEDMWQGLPKSIRQEVSVHLYYDLIASVPIFKTTDVHFKVALCERMSTIAVKKGFYICKIGDAGQEMYFIREGSVDILTGDESRVIVSLGAGSFFGEIALFEQCTRTATAITSSDTQLCVLKKRDFSDLFNLYPDMVDVFKAAIVQRKAEDALRVKRLKEAEEKKRLEELERRRLEEMERRREEDDRAPNSKSMLATLRKRSEALLERAKTSATSTHSVLASKESVPPTKPSAYFAAGFASLAQSRRGSRDHGGESTF